MKFKDIYKQKTNDDNFASDSPIISFEVFPPKNKEKNDFLINELKELIKYNPKTISVTYGAGGSGRENSIQLVKLLKTNFKIDIMPHFTCVNATKGSVENYLEEISTLGINKILALRGDIPFGEKIINFDFKHANNLVDFIKSKSDLNIAVAGYPEGHTEADSIESDILNLKKKVNAGAEIIYTQLFFNNKYYIDYLEKVKNNGINIPIIPGILPITNYNQLTKMTTLCKVTIPKGLLIKLEKHKDDAAAIREIGTEFAIEQVKELLNYGIKGFHFYILNKATPINLILDEVLKTTWRR